jgi:hypothetical protein
MKTFLLIISVLVIGSAWGELGAEESVMVARDTIRVGDSRRLEIIEGHGKTRIKIFELTDDGEKLVSDNTYGGYREHVYGNKGRERSVLNFRAPWTNRSYNPHWGGFGVGFLSLSSGGLGHINDVMGLGLKSESSLEYNLNILEQSYILSHGSGWALVTGAGLRWSRFRLDERGYLAESGGITTLHNVAAGMLLESSKLNITAVTIPLMLEWQDVSRKNASPFISAGLVAVIKTASASKIVYTDGGGSKQKDKMDSGMNLRPVTCDVLLQAGFGCLGAYARYSPIGLFEKDKGPEVFPVSIGLQLYW